MKHRHQGPKVRYHTRKGNVRFRERPMHVQTLIFPKNKFNRKEALEWAKEHGYEDYTSRETENTIRVRQIPPKDVKRYGGIFPIGEDVKGLYAEVDKDKYKDKPYPYLRRKFKISAKGDDDKDGVINKNDCRPWDKKRQDENEVDKLQRELDKLEQEKDKIENKYNLQISNLEDKEANTPDEPLYYDTNLALKEIMQGTSTKEDINHRIVGLIHQRDEELSEINSEIKEKNRMIDKFLGLE